MKEKKYIEKVNYSRSIRIKQLLTAAKCESYLLRANYLVVPDVLVLNYVVGLILAYLKISLCNQGFHLMIHDMRPTEFSASVNSIWSHQTNTL